MSHNHKHCAHTHLSFCSTCQVVYCHDCSQEWTQRTTWAFPNTFTYGTTTNLPGSNVNPYPPNTVLCRHGGT